MKENKSISKTSTTKASPLASSPFFQPKLTVNTPGDAYEQEADAMADTVMRMPEGDAPFFASISKINGVQRKCATCQDEEKVQRKETSDSSGQTAPPEVAQTLSSSNGQPLDTSTQQFMGSRFGHDFSQVRVKTDAQAASSAQAIQAKAYTSGTDIVFGSGEYQPSTTEGKRLLAHELTHVVQQGGGQVGVQRDGLMDPFAGEPPVDVEALRNRVLAPARRFDATGFTSQLRHITYSERDALLEDIPFWNEIRQTFHGKALWSVFTIIFYNNRMPALQRRLSMALSFGTVFNAIDALSVIMVENEEVLPEIYWDLLTEVIFDVYRGDPNLRQLFRLIILREYEDSSPRHLDVTTSGVHYEVNATGSYALKQYTSTRGLIAYTTQDEFRVIVRIKFVSGTPPQPYNFRGEGEQDVPDRWRTSIESFWNNKFLIGNRHHVLSFVVSPIFVFDEGPADKTIGIIQNDSQTCPGVLQAGRPNAGCWFVNADGVTVAHEFGHLLGAKDEYNLPGSAAEIPAEMQANLSPKDLERTTVEGITGRARRFREGGHDISSLMGSHNRSTDVYARHIQALITAFNASQPDSPPYTIARIP